jgi:anti-sigma factor RsiW
VQAKLSAYLDGELGGFDMLEMRSHIHRCGPCSNELEDLRQIKRALGSMPVATPDQEFAARLKHAVATAQPADRKLPLTAMSALAFAAALLVSLQVLHSKRESPVTAQQPQVAVTQPNFDLQRDQAYQAGGDYFNDGSFVLTTSAPVSRH